MIKLNIGKGFLVITDENGQIYPGWLGDELPNYPYLPEVGAVYDRCVARNYAPERTIDVLLRLFHRQRIVRGGFLTGIPLVIGLVGGAGAGKSCGGAAIAIYDYLLAGVPVISNMDIEVKVRYKAAEKIFRTQSLDKTSVFNIKSLETMYSDCCLFVDEVNIEFSEARRSMSNRNLVFSYMLQERRKRRMNIIHTEQSEMWGDERLRFATSLFISCKDAAYSGGLPKEGSLGRKSYWKMHDVSGVINGEIVGSNDPRLIVWEGEFHNTPFWHSYDSWKIQGLDDDSTQKSDIIIKNGKVLTELKEKYKMGRQVADKVREMGLVEVESGQLWESLGITDRSTQTKLGADFAGLGIPVRQQGRKRFYNFGDSDKED